MKNKKKALQWSCELVDINQNLKDNESQLFEALAHHLDDLINHDFNKLISILYRIDVSQEKLIKALSNRKKDQTQGQVIADLIIERQLQKLKLREQFKRK